MLLDDMERPVLDPIAERNHPAHKNALLFGGSDLVSDAFARDFALDLGEGQEDVQGQAPMLVVVLNDWVTETKDT